VAQETSGQSVSTPHASKPRVMESPTAASEAGLLSQAGVGFGEGFALAVGAAESPPTASHPATPTRAAVRTAATARERWPCLRIRGVPLVKWWSVHNNAPEFPAAPRERSGPVLASCRVNGGRFGASGPTVRHTPCAAAR